VGQVLRGTDCGARPHERGIGVRYLGTQVQAGLPRYHHGVRLGDRQLTLRDTAPKLGGEQFGRHDDEGTSALQGPPQRVEQLTGERALHHLERFVRHATRMERSGHQEAGAATRLLCSRRAECCRADTTAGPQLFGDLLSQGGVRVNDRHGRSLHLGNGRQEAEHGGGVEAEVTAAFVGIAQPAQVQSLERTGQPGIAVRFQVDTRAGADGDQALLFQPPVRGGGGLAVDSFGVGHIADARQSFSRSPVAQKDACDDPVPELIDDDGAWLLATHAGLPIRASKGMLEKSDHRCARLVPIKPFYMTISAFIGLLLASAPLPAQDSAAALYSAARSAEARYERMARWLAPGTYRGSSDRCGEVVGRFCLTFDTLSKPPTAPERREVSEARARALTALRSFAAHAPGDLRAAGPLVRLLVEARQPEEAVSVAASFASQGSDPQWGDWLHGYALHAAGRDSAAAARFRRALERATAQERERITSIEWLLSSSEWKRVRSLPDSARAAYVERFWRVADPMWQTAVNATWVAHVARHVETRLLERMPTVQGMMSWGDDLAELTVRYGRPIARERNLYNAQQGLSSGLSMIEHFDTTALAYAPEALLQDGLPGVPPGARWPLRAPDARSGHSPPALRRTYPLEHQLTRIPRGENMLVRLDARVPADSGGAAGAHTLLAARSWRGDSLASASGALGAESGEFTLEIAVPRDTLLVAAEVFDPASRTLQRLRQGLEPLPRGDVELSDILLTRPLPDSSDSEERAPALTSLLLTPSRNVGVRVEMAGVQAGEQVAVEVSFVRADAPSLLARAIGWAGRRLGVTGDVSPPRVRWNSIAGEPAVLQVNLASPERPGSYFVEVLVRSPRGEAATRRLVRVVSAAEAGS